MIKINAMVIVIIVIAVLAFFYFIFKQNKKDQKKLEKELNDQEIKPEKHDEEHI